MTEVYDIVEYNVEHNILEYNDSSESLFCENAKKDNINTETVSLHHSTANDAVHINKPREKSKLITTFSNQKNKVATFFKRQIWGRAKTVGNYIIKKVIKKPKKTITISIGNISQSNEINNKNQSIISNNTCLYCTNEQLYLIQSILNGVLQYPNISTYALLTNWTINDNLILRYLESGDWSEMYLNERYVVLLFCIHIFCICIL
jgi:hypothetical protein